MARNVNTNRSPNFCFKLILLGDYNVGKSSIFCRFKSNIFKENTKSTIGTDNFAKSFEIDSQNVTVSSACFFQVINIINYLLICYCSVISSKITRKVLFVCVYFYAKYHYLSQ